MNNCVKCGAFLCEDYMELTICLILVDTNVKEISNARIDIAHVMRMVNICFPNWDISTYITCMNVRDLSCLSRTFCCREVL